MKTTMANPGAAPNGGGGSGPGAAAAGAGRALPGDSPLAGIAADLTHLLAQVAMMRRQATTAAEEHERQTRQLLLDLLEVTDSFELLFADAERLGDDLPADARSQVANFRTVCKLLHRALKRAGVEPAPVTVGAPIDVNWHQVSEAVPRPGQANETVAEVERGAWRWRDRPLRVATVKAVRNPD